MIMKQAPPVELIDCYPCDGLREVRAGMCIGCGTFVENAARHLVIAHRAATRRRMRCPLCKSNRTKTLDDHGRICLHCNTAFEPADVYSVEGHPLQSVLKRRL